MKGCVKSFPGEKTSETQPSIGGVGSEKARLATLKVIAAAMACGLTLDEAKELAAAQVMVAAAIVENPGQAAAILRHAHEATARVVGIKAATRGRRAA